MKKALKFPETYLYQSTSVWVEDRGRGLYRIGITDFAQYQLDDIVSVSLPEENVTVKKNEDVISIDSIEDTLIIKAPLSGLIKAVNEELLQSAEMINESPYKKGWLIEIEIGNEDELDELIDFNEVTDLYQEEIERLEDDDEEDEDEDDDWDLDDDEWVESDDEWNESDDEWGY